MHHASLPFSPFHTLAPVFSFHQLVLTYTLILDTLGVLAVGGHQFAGAVRRNLHEAPPLYSVVVFEVVIQVDVRVPLLAHGVAHHVCREEKERADEWIVDFFSFLKD